MKTAIYIEQGVTQLVLTPENNWESDIISRIPTGTNETQILKGSFYECQGGWNRRGESDESLILRTPIKTQAEQI